LTPKDTKSPKILFGWTYIGKELDIWRYQVPFKIKGFDSPQLTGVEVPSPSNIDIFHKQKIQHFH